MTAGALREICALNGLQLSDEKLSQLERFADLLKKKNEALNLISRKDEDNILEKHILHSLSLAMPGLCGFSIPENAHVFDLGTGGGLPGIPLAIVRSNITIVLCDSIAKKIAALEEMIRALSLANVNAVTARAETLAKNEAYRKKFDLIVSRAVAPLDDLAKWSHELLKKGGTLLSLKGGDISEEIKRTTRSKYVAEVAESPLALISYELFTRDEKKVVCVTFGS
jgi:16S rRNA (guanine527-N7)-methyltransferase